MFISKDIEYKGNLSKKSKGFSIKMFRVLNYFDLLWDKLSVHHGAKEII